jgi:type VI secretion system secreted protein Hcp
MAYGVYVTVTGAKQGAFKGESTQKGRAGKILVSSVAYGVAAVRGLTSGQAAGKSIEQPLIFSKAWGAASPQFFNAAYTNELLSSVLFEYYTQALDGTEKIDHTVKLTNAAITEIHESYASTTPAGTPDGKDSQTISVVFQKIEITSTTGGTSAIDSLTPNV